MLNEFVEQSPGDSLGHLSRLAPNGSFTQALQRSAQSTGIAIVAELKHASPSEGPLLRGSEAAYLAAVRRGGAACISAVTAGGRFHGSMQTLRAAHTTGLPTLMKDFVTQATQLDAAVHNGASAILLIERVLGADRRDELIQQAHARGLQVLLEVHQEDEARAALRSKADAIGVNSRDLDTLNVDVKAAQALVHLLATQTRRPVLLLSGIQEFASAQNAREAGATGILVGTALLRARDPALLCRSLQRSLVKVCGNRTPADVTAAHGADLIGVVVGTQSRRDVPLDLAAPLLRQAERQGSASVAVTRFTDAATLLALARTLRPTFLQVHGALSRPMVQEIQREGIGVLHAIRAGDKPIEGCDGTISDSSPEGGDGHPHDGFVPLGPGLHLVAGGLHAANVALAIFHSGAVGADASSGLESHGCKDAVKVTAFIAASQAAQRRRADHAA